MSQSKSSPMLLVCPSCGTFGAVECFSNDADARVVAELLAKLPSDAAPALLRYLRLFKPAKHALTWQKARAVLEVLAPMVLACSIERSGRHWDVPHEAWAPAVDQMLANRNLSLPLKSHGYLLQILVGVADKTEAVQERQAETVVQQDGAARRARISAAQQEIHSMNVARRERGLAPLTADEAAPFWRRNDVEPPV